MVGKAIGEIQTIRPFLKWAGSKRLILSTLAGYWSADFERYIEPFAGSSSLFFYLQPKRALLGDINSDLIETYEQIKHNVDDVSSDLAKMTKGKDEYYRIRSIDIKTLSTSQRAARFIYLNKLSFNGLYRTNQKGDFNVPFGGEKAGPVPTKESLQRCSKALQRVQLFSGDFGLVLERAQPGDFVYLDPPYSVKSRRIFNEYGKSSFSTAELKRLRQWLDKLTKLGVVFLLSYAKSSEAKLLMDGYPTKEINVRRNIAGFSQYRRNAKEWLASNRDLLNERKNVREKNR